MSASSPNKVTRLIVLCCLLSASVANSETFTSVTADTVNADTVNTGVINATTGNVTTLNATNLNISGTVSLDAIGVSVEDLEYMGGTLSGIEGIGVDGGGASLAVGDSAASLLVEDQLGTGNNGITVSPTQTLITGGSGDASALPDNDDIDADTSSLTIDGDGIDFDSSKYGASLDMSGHTISTLGDGTELDDAVNLGQLLQAITDEAVRADGHTSQMTADEAVRADGYTDQMTADEAVRADGYTDQMTADEAVRA
ncbi:MAG: hypothetical protein HRU02_17255, partial [Myxococcales bacterium]|nr:hypothetical protein [Myxococcales bacterium]